MMVSLRNEYEQNLFFYRLVFHFHKFLVNSNIFPSQSSGGDGTTSTTGSRSSAHCCPRRTMSKFLLADTEIVEDFFINFLESKRFWGYIVPFLGVYGDFQLLSIIPKAK